MCILIWKHYLLARKCWVTGTVVIPSVVIVKNEFDARRDVRKDVEHEEDDQEERREGMTTAGLGATHFAKRSRSHSIHKIYHKNTVFTGIWMYL